RLKGGQVFGARGAVHGGEHGLCQALQVAAVVIGKDIGLTGKSFDNSDGLFTDPDGNGEDGSDVESAASVGVNPGIEFAVIAAKRASRLHAIAGESAADLKSDADRGRTGTGAGAAFHEMRIGGGQCDRCAGTADQSLCAGGNQLEGRTEIRTEKFHF